MATAQRQAPQVTPEPIMQITFAFATTRVLASAVELDLLTEIDQGANTIETLSAATQCSPRGLRIILNALVALKLLERDKEHFRLTPAAATFLSQNSPQYLGGVVMHSAQLQPRWEHLTETIRGGRPVRAVESSDDHGEFFSHFVDALYALSAGAAEVAAKTLIPAQPAADYRVLDIGAGSAVWSLAFARQMPSARVTVADWPVVIEKITRKFAERHGVADRYDYLEGNFREEDFGASRFDVALLGHICHSEGTERSRTLFRRVHRALKPGGQILIAEMVPDEVRREAVFPLIFAVNMLVNTEEGDTFTFGEYRRWLEEAGFRDVRTLEAPAPSPLILGTKA